MVAPRAGAWVEITNIVVRSTSTLSLLVQERGLKSKRLVALPGGLPSLLVQERGLKYYRRWDCGGGIMKNGTPASPATARPRRVLPVPGGPTKRTPFGI
jgi:hypothetical protein